jgi:hypothetical protein
MRNAAVPNNRKVGTRSSRTTSSSMDMQNQRPEHAIWDKSLAETYHGTSL